MHTNTVLSANVAYTIYIYMIYGIIYHIYIYDIL